MPINFSNRSIKKQVLLCLETIAIVSSTILANNLAVSADSPQSTQLAQTNICPEVRIQVEERGMREGIAK
jgi:hypothetical protein